MAGIRGARTVQTVDGVSFASLLAGRAPALPDRSLFWHYPNSWGPTGPGIGASSTVRRGDWKLIYYHVGPRFELFNLAADLGEETNLADSEPARVRELAGILTRHLRAVDAQMPVDKRTGKAVEWPSEAAARLDAGK